MTSEAVSLGENGCWSRTDRGRAALLRSLCTDAQAKPSEHGFQAADAVLICVIISAFSRQTQALRFVQHQRQAEDKGERGAKNPAEQSASEGARFLVVQSSRPRRG